MQSEIDGFFGTLKEGPEPGQALHNTTVFKARHKIEPSAFFRMNDSICEYFYEHGQAQLWEGLRLVAADGSTLRLEDWPDIAEYFGRQEQPDGTLSCPLARISELFDPLNHITLAGSIEPYRSGEREMLLSDARWMREGSLLVADRGYAAFWLFVWLLRRRCHFCMRLAVDQWKCARQFIATGAKEALIELELPSQESREQCRRLGLPTDSISIRLIRVELADGEIEVLGTSLLDSAAFAAPVFGDLYHLRWPIEEKVKHDKCRTEMENFSGKSAFTVMQDFYARIFANNLTRMLTHVAQPEIDERHAQSQYHYQPNQASAINAVKKAFCDLFFGACLSETIRRLYKWFVHNVSPIRPGRRYPRNHKRERRGFYINYKPCL